MSLEVAEHLPPECAEAFVDELISLSPVILFSAAIPKQGGEDHVNEQWPEYWAEKFQQRGYQIVDYLRRIIWSNPKVACYYKQNILIFIDKDYLEKYPGIKQAISNDFINDIASLSFVHPTIYINSIERLTNLEKTKKLEITSPENIPLKSTLSILTKRTLKKFKTLIFK